MDTSLHIMFEMDVHCINCARRIRRSLMEMFGAAIVTASVSTGIVAVRGGAQLDPCTLKCFLLRFIETRHRGRRGRRGVSTISDGGRPQRCHFEGIRHLGPSPAQYGLPQQPYYYGGNNGYSRGSWYDDEEDYYDTDGGCTIM